MRVSAILDSIELGNMALPEFQRGYVWSRDQVRGLMQSLYRKYPVGSLLTWTTQAGSATARGVEFDESKVIDLLLDGQQRITSLYGIIRGHEPTFFQGNAKAFTDLYFDLRTETFEFYGPVKMKDDPLWVNVTDLFKTGLGPWFGIATELQLEATTQATYLERLNRVTSIADLEFHVERITGEKEVDEVVEIFNKVNSGGTKLSKGDLALATLCGQWPDARVEIRGMVGEWAEAGYDFEIDWLLRCTTAVGTNQAKFSALRHIGVDEFRSALERSKKAIDFLLNLVAGRLGLDHNRVLGGRYSFAVLSRVVDSQGGSVTDPVEQGKLLYWYVHALMWGRYSGSTETMLARDLEAFNTAGIDGLIAEMERWRGSLEVRAADFDTSTVGSRPYAVIYMLSRVSGARDLLTGLELSASMLGSSNNLELHHIIPKSLTRDHGYEQGQINAIGNFCFLTADSNKSISASDPQEYLAKVRADRPGVLESQWIPTDETLWSLERYPDFLAARRELLAAATTSLLNSLRSGEIGEELPSPTHGHASPAHTHSDDLVEIVQLCGELGIAAPYLSYEIVDDESNEVLAIADAVWPEGVQVGLSQPLAYLAEPDETMEARLGELGYRFFTDRHRLGWHFEHLLGRDLDGDGIVGEPGHHG